ncbi:MAG: TraR/DksA family transcriptional regulator [Streptosporangiaceae bacterium]
MTGLSPQQRGAARSRLAAERERTTARLAALQRDLESIIASTASAAGADDEHDPEGSSTAFDRQHVAALLASAKDQLAAIDRAGHRLDDGSYGRSVRSGVPIPDERLEADPAAELTVEEARQAERDAEHEQARDVGH